MKKRIIFLIGTIAFLAVLSMTVQFNGNGSGENNNLSIQNLEALAGGNFLCSNTCYYQDNDCCVHCGPCDAFPDMNETDIYASECLQME